MSDGTTMQNYTIGSALRIPVPEVMHESMPETVQIQLKPTGEAASLGKKQQNRLIGLDQHRSHD